MSQLCGKVLRDMGKDGFDVLCSMICDGRYRGEDVSPDMDNMFYAYFGMSSGEVSAQLKLFRRKDACEKQGAFY